MLLIDLPNSLYAYARVYKDSVIGVYDEFSKDPNSPPIGQRNFLFFVGAYQNILKSGKFRIINVDPFSKEEDVWSPPMKIIDPITKKFSIYYKGVIKPSDPSLCSDLEIAAVWGANEIIERIMRMYLKKFY